MGALGDPGGRNREHWGCWNSRLQYRRAPRHFNNKYSCVWRTAGEQLSGTPLLRQPIHMTLASSPALVLRADLARTPFHWRPPQDRELLPAHMEKM